MMLHNLDDEDSKIAFYNSYSHSSAKPVSDTPDEPAAGTVWVGRSDKDRSGMACKPR
jgi:hypothetical protein